MKHPSFLRQVVALSLVKNMGPVSFKKLLEAFGSVPGIFGATQKRFQAVEGVGKIRHAELQNKELLKKADLEIEKAAKAHAEIVTFFDERYPEDLKQIYDPPILLYVKGRLPSVHDSVVAIVGSRVASLYGRRTAQRIARDLAEARVVIVSGMAIGIDSAAHEGALQADGVTVAVLGGGLSKIYPAENKKLAAEIAKKGAVISEYPMEMSPRPQYFPIRNRIISGLSKAVLVVEAREKSGALITVDAALDQGRDVFAVPGNVDSARSGGTHALLKQGAKLVTCAEDILSELQIRPVRASQKSGGEISFQKEVRGLSAEENKVLSLLDSQSVPVDELVEQSGLPTHRAIATLSLLEIKGFAKQLPGKYFIRTEKI